MARSFLARTNSGNCGLCEVAFVAGEHSMWLTGPAGSTRPDPQAQIESDRRRFRQVRTGSKLVRGREVPTYGWQERRGRSWVSCEVWEQMVHISCARSRGYRTPGEMTVAKYGTRTEGHAHRVAQMAQAVANVATVAATITPETVGAAITQAEATGEFNPYRSLVPPVTAPREATTLPNDAVRNIELDESKPTTRDANDLSDVSHIVERFKRLDLD